MKRAVGTGGDAEYPARRVLAAASPLLLLPAYFALTTFLAGRGHTVALDNSDLLHPYMILQDLLGNVDTPWWWHHSPALYIYPDWLTVLAVMALPVPHLWWPLLHSPLQLTLFAVAGGALLSVGGAARPVAAIWTVAAAIFAAGLMAAAFPGRYGAQYFVSIGAPYIHGGAALITLAGAALLVFLLSGRGGRWHEAVLAAGVFSAAFSDLFFIAWFVLPGAAVALAHAWAARARRSVRVAAMILVSAAMAVTLETWLHGKWRLFPKHDKTAADFLEAVRNAGADMLARDPLTALIVLVALVAIAAAVPVFVGTLRRRPPSAADMMSLLLGGSAAAAILAPFAAGMIGDPDTFRYFLVLGPLAAVAIALAALRVSAGGGLRAKMRVALAGGLVLAGGAALAMPAARAVPRLVAPPGLQTCLEAEGRTTGLGDYWTAKALMFRSGRKIHIIQILPWHDRFRWNYNERWFTHRADDDFPVRPDFIVVRNLEQDRLVRLHGDPARIVPCAGTAIWLYDRPIAVPP